MKRFSLLIAITLLQTTLAVGQYTRDDSALETQPNEDKKGIDFNRLYVGGSLGAQFGTFTFVNLSPDLGYWFTDRFTAGIGARYLYFSDSRTNYSTTIVGGSIFARYLITPEIFGHVEYEVLNGRFDPTREKAFNISSLFVGGGYMQSLGDRFFTGIMLLYNVNDSVYSPYRNPVIRVTFGLGL